MTGLGGYLVRRAFAKRRTRHFGAGDELVAAHG